MRPLPRLAGLLVPALVALPAIQAGGGQGSLGRPLPGADALEDFSQTEARSYDDYVGRVVLVEFFAYWCSPSRASMAELEAIQQRFGARGVSVIGVTAEGKSSTARFVEEAGASFAYAFDRSGALARAAEVDTFPTALLIDPTGTVVWRGDVGDLTDELIAKHLEGAFETPLWEWPKAARDAVKHLKKRAYGRALAELGDAPELGDLRADVRSILRKRTQSLATAQELGDVLGVERLAEAMESEVAGLPAEEEIVRTALESLRASAEARRVLKLQRELERLRTTRISGDRDLERLIDAVERLRADAAGTYAGGQAEAFLRELRRLSYPPRNPRGQRGFRGE